MELCCCQPSIFDQSIFNQSHSNMLPAIPPPYLFFTLAALAHVHLSLGQLPCPSLGGVVCNGGACIAGTCKCGVGIVGVLSFSIRHCFTMTTTSLTLCRPRLRARLPRYCNLITPPDYSCKQRCSCRCSAVMQRPRPVRHSNFFDCCVIVTS